MTTLSTTSKFEKWHSEIAGRYFIKRFTPNGMDRETVYGYSDFFITPEERALNQSGCKPGQDPFTNGTFSAVVLVETDDDLYKIDLGPNHITDTEVEELLGSMHWKKAQSKLASIDAVPALVRILEKALASDAGEKRIQQIRDRLTAVAPDHPQPNRVTRVAEFTSDVPGPEEFDIYDTSPKDGPRAEAFTTGTVPPPQGVEGNPGGWDAPVI